MSKRFVVRRDNLRQTRWEDRPPVTLEDGSVRLRIDAFALTSNNITYAAVGEAMNYWGFYPTGDATTGCIPVWGFASVVESRYAGVDVGERFYGFWLIADEAVLQPARVNAGGFFDARRAPARAAPGVQPVPALYRRPGLCGRARGRAGAAAPVVRHLVPDRRLSRLQQVLRCTHRDPVKCVKQDRLRHRVLPRTAARRNRCGEGHRVHVAGQRRVHALARLL